MKTMNDRLVERFSAPTLLLMARTLCVVVFIINVITIVAICAATYTLYQYTSGWITYGLIMMAGLGGLDTLANMLKGVSFFLRLPFKIGVLYVQRDILRPLEPS
jgi:hypothetical protein